MVTEHHGTRKYVAFMSSILHLKALDQRRKGTTTRLKKVDDGGVYSRFYVHTDST